jgi:hypothetical protein
VVRTRLKWHALTWLWPRFRFLWRLASSRDRAPNSMVRFAACRPLGIGPTVTRISNCLCWRQLGIANRVLDRAVAEPILQRPRIMPCIRQDVPRSPELAVEENRVLPDRRAADFQLVGGEIGVGIADRQAAQDRQLLRNVQLRADDFRIPDDRDLDAAA